MQINKRNQLDIIVLGLVSSPISQCCSLNGGPRFVASIAFGARIVLSRGAIPFEAKGSIKINATAKGKRGVLSILAPKSVVVPRVRITIGVERWHKNNVVLFEQFSHARKFTVP